MDAKKVKKHFRLAEEPDAEFFALLEGIEDRPAEVGRKVQGITDLNPVSKELEKD